MSKTYTSVNFASWEYPNVGMFKIDRTTERGKKTHEAIVLQSMPFVLSPDLKPWKTYQRTGWKPKSDKVAVSLTITEIVDDEDTSTPTADAKGFDLDAL